MPTLLFLLMLLVPSIASAQVQCFGTPPTICYGSNGYTAQFFSQPGSNVTQFRDNRGNSAQIFQGNGALQVYPTTPTPNWGPAPIPSMPALGDFSMPAPGMPGPGGMPPPLPLLPTIQFR